ncbi:methyltransferase domain-containing protein [Pseudorhizobium flavum]|uniref:methyltransferase domain-containing protein n=1 Tax=Pseudorhizobium flavum TaxID=1335061 RepID=UPI0037702025
MRRLEITKFPDADSLLKGAKDRINEADVVLDIGCGIMPMNYFRPRLHIMAEPWEEYANILEERYHGDKSVLIIKIGALETLQALVDDSVDSIFMLDVIEHLDKSMGLEVLREIDRVCRQQAVLFTPLGFMPQHMDEGEKDGWGLSGAQVQEHKSGWLPEDFNDGWEFLVCDTFHTQAYDGEALPVPFGAFFAIRNYGHKVYQPKGDLSDIRRPLPSEIALAQTRTELESARAEMENVRAESLEMKMRLEACEQALNSLNKRIPIRVLRRLKLV